MRPFVYERPADLSEAVELGAAGTYLAGGTNLVDLMRQEVERPERVIDISRLPLDRIEDLPGGGLRIGALARNARVAADDRVRARYPVLARALLSGASPQLRNRATVGGNLLQRTRCGYFYDVGAACNKRVPGAGCEAIGGLDRGHAVLGASESCVAVHPSDMCVALAALGATVNLAGVHGARAVPVTDFHLLPGRTPHVETVLGNDLVTSVDLPPGLPAHGAYVKVRDRASFAFALVSVAVLLHVEDGGIGTVRIALGGVAARPWRAYEAEELLTGAAPDERAFREAAVAALAGARPLRDNAFKAELARRLIQRTLTELAGPS
ncbi:xanthine dehydrogenase YagS FAD-binding subunit [Nonomuraea solani]|uniref:Xanthine dehydrogenase YagS FAD-binding subunit n=1 Tax=Nonomuraea solani TaxID=1144553 RepID=A0A1H6E431_9ACTN|nr:xanthine dehydrogenase family protein subunit M [Nonomuraea solani]SEG91766.1 xanthine dehydrogenase YagS FAD-binding subunit [Nonomuraea solani]